MANRAWRRKFKSKKRKKQDLSTIKGLKKLAISVGLKKEAEEITTPKLSFFQRIGRGLTAFETGNALYQQRYEGKDFIQEYATDIGTGFQEAFTGKTVREKPKMLFKDIMMKEGMKDRPGKMDAIDFVGLLGDIVTDPTTFLGGFIGRGIIKGSKVVGKGVKKLPVVGKGINKLEDLAGGLFKPFHKVEKELGETGVAYHNQFLKHARGTRAAMDEHVERIAELAGTLKKKIGKKAAKKAGVTIGEAVETGTKTGNKFMDETLDALVSTQNAITRQEVKLGLLKSQIPDYMHHMLTDEAADFLLHKGNVAGFLRPISSKLDAAKQRGIEGIVKEINKSFKKIHKFNLFEENAFKAFAQRGVKGIKAVQTKSFLNRVGNNFGMAAKGQKKFIDDAGMTWTKAGGIDELDDILLPEPIAKHLSDTVNALFNDEALNEVVKYYDKAHRVFKASVTGIFPAFHTRNATGGLFNNWIAGLKNPKMYADADTVIRGGKGMLKIKNAKAMSYDTVRQLTKEYGVVGQTGYLDVAQYLQKELDPSIASTLLKSPQKVMGVIENYLRVPLFMDGLQKGMKPADAARRVIQFHFDYMPEGFTKFERTFMKRLIPFYTWTRNNIPLQLEQIIAQPGKYAGVFKAHNAWGVQPSSEEEAILPSWLKDRFVIKDEGGYWAGLGLPLEEMTEKVNDPVRGFAISMSPFVKTPIEAATGFNIFKERRISEDKYGKVYRNAPEWLQNWLELKKTKSKSGKIFYTVNPKRRYLLEAIFTRTLNTGLKLANATDEGDSIGALLTTINKHEYSMKDLKRWSDTEDRKKLETMLKDAGEIAEFKRVFIPKDKKKKTRKKSKRAWRR